MNNNDLKYLLTHIDLDKKIFIITKLKLGQMELILII